MIARALALIVLLCVSCVSVQQPAAATAPQGTSNAGQQSSGPAAQQQQLAPPPATPGHSSLESTEADPAFVSPDLIEVRRIFGGTDSHRVAPVDRSGGDAVQAPVVVDTRSTLRLHFDEHPVDGTSSLAAAFSRIAAAFPLDEVNKQIAQITSSADVTETYANGLFSDKTQNVEIFLAQLASTFSDAITVSRTGYLPATKEVIVEAYRLNGKTRTALSLPSYNEIGSGKTESTATPQSTPATPQLKQAADHAVSVAHAIRSLLAANRTKKTLPDAAAAFEKKLSAALDAPAPRHVGNLPISEINLPANDVKRGDTVELNVYSVPKSTGTGGADTTRSRSLETAYVVDVERLGWYRDDAVIPTLSRGDTTGDAGSTDWKLNFAATGTWSYYTGKQDFWSWMQMGAGVHLASLDQSDDEDIELGIGVHVSLWEGLLVGGVGANLMVDSDRTYYFIGGDLLAWRDKLSKAGDKD